MRKIVISLYIIFNLAGCGFCITDADNYAYLSNTFRTEITVDFRIQLYSSNPPEQSPEYKYFSEKIPTNKSIEIYLETHPYGDPIFPTPDVLCNALTETKKIRSQTITFSRSTLSQYTICLNYAISEYKINQIGTECNEGEKEFGGY